MILTQRKQVNTFFKQNVSNDRAASELVWCGLAGRGQRPTQQSAAHRPFENKGLAHRNLSGKVAKLIVIKSQSERGVRVVEGPSDAKVEPVCNHALAFRGGGVAQARREIYVAVFSGSKIQDDPPCGRWHGRQPDYERLGTRREVVSLWRKRFFADRLAGLEEHARPGRPRTFPPRSRGSN
jgi:hypothetical protein